MILLEREFLHSHTDKSVFVLPAFEVSSEEADDMPKNKRQLLSRLEEEKVRPFYYDICWKCQRPTDYKKWQGLVCVLNFTEQFRTQKQH